MVSLETPVCEFDQPIVDFSLPGVDGKVWTPELARGENGLLVTLGVNTVAIMSNDPAEYEEDSFENMQAIAAEYGFPFPYLIDETQDIAKAYGAVCTPDFFGYNKFMALQYRGRLDESRKEAAADDVRRDLFEAMKQVAQTGRGPEQQIPSMGCSIKWKTEA